MARASIRGRLAWGLVALALASTACGGGERSSTSELGEVDLASAINQTLDAPAFALTMDITTVIDGESIYAHAEGVTSADGLLAQMTMTAGGPLGGDGEFIVVDDTQYLSGVTAALFVGAGGDPSAEWLAVPVPEAFNALTGSSPAQGVEFLETLGQVAGTDLEYGVGEHGGEPMTTVSMEVPVSAAFEAQGVSAMDVLAAQPGMNQRPEMEQARLADALSDVKQDLTVWIDDTGLVRRTSGVMDMTSYMSTAGTSVGEMRMTLDFTFDVIDSLPEIVAPTEGVVPFDPW